MKLAAWTTNNSYTSRVTLIKTTGVGASKQYKLNFTTVNDDNAIDSLFGGAGNDWFWAGNNDTHDKTASEQLN